VGPPRDSVSMPLEASALVQVARSIPSVQRDCRYRAVGFVTCEAGAAFGLDAADSSPELPFVWFGLFEPDGFENCGLAPPGTYALTDLKPAVGFAQFEATASDQGVSRRRGNLPGQRTAVVRTDRLLYSALRAMGAVWSVIGRAA
jgi:hypothetical protein